MVDIKDKCTGCIHNGLCKHTNDYSEFYSRIYEVVNRLDGDIIAEGVAEVKVACKFYKSKPETRRQRDMSAYRIEELKAVEALAESTATTAPNLTVDEYIRKRRKVNND